MLDVIKTVQNETFYVIGIKQRSFIKFLILAKYLKL